MRVAVTGTVFSGMGKGSYYVGHPEYQRRFTEALGYAPYPGTLNMKLEDAESIEEVRQVRASGGTRVNGFTEGRESFSGLSCFDGELRGVRVALLFIDVTYYNETVAELISPEYLRGRLGLKDGERVTFAVEAPGLRDKP
jgi:riboflavin kinase, archaea type